MRQGISDPMNPTTLPAGDEHPRDGVAQPIMGVRDHQLDAPALASDYLQLRMSDELRRLLDAVASFYAESLRITGNQYRAGTTHQSAVSEAEAQLDSTQAQAIAVTRAQLGHAIAV
jgi:hypothetical protein